MLKWRKTIAPRNRLTWRAHDERRLVERMLRHWQEMTAWGWGFPRYDEIDPWMVGEDWSNCFLITVRSPLKLSRFISLGDNLLPELSGKVVASCPPDTLLGVLLSHLPAVVSGQRCLIIEGGASHRDAPILYRGALLPLSEDGLAIDHVLGTASYRLLREDEELIAPVTRMEWLR